MTNCTCKKWGCEENCICGCHREVKICGTCKEEIKEDMPQVDDGILEGVYHHAKCY